MKKLITFLMLLTLFGVSSVWAQTEFTYNTIGIGAGGINDAISNGITSDYVSIAFSGSVECNEDRILNSEKISNFKIRKDESNNNGAFTVSGRNSAKIKKVTVKGVDSYREFSASDATSITQVPNTSGYWSWYWQAENSVSSITLTNNSTGNAYIYEIEVEYEVKTNPTLSFDYGTSCAAVIPANEASTTVYNALTTNSDGAVTWSVVDAGTTSATVSNESGTKGYVTVSAEGTATIRASVAESTTYNAGSLDYTLSVTKASASPEDNFTIDISKLMMPVGVNANRDINRTIPRVTLTFGGGDGIKFNETDKFIIRNEGTFNVALRKSSDAAKINSIVLHGDFSKYTKADINDNITASSGTIVKTDDNTLTWTAASGGADDVTFTSVKVSGVSATISSFDVTTNGEALDNSKVTPTFAFSPASATASTAASGSYTTTLTSSPGFFNAISFNDGETGTTLKGTDFIYGTTNTKYTLTSGTTAGSATLTASFAGNDYFNAVSATTYTLTVSAGKAELTDFSFNKDEATYTGTGGTIYVNSKELTNAGTSGDPFTFVYDASRSTLKTKFFLDPSLTTIGAEANSTYFEVTSADLTILDVSNATFSATNNGTRLYVDGINVLKAGTTSLTFTFKGSTNYNSKSVTVYFKAEEPITTYSGTYPYTWNFTNETSWTSSSIQSAYYYSQWERNGNAAKLASGSTSVPKDNGIDKIDGLAFNPTDGNQDKLWLDWNVNKVSIDGTMTVPNLSPDYEVSIQAPTGQTIKVGETTLTEESGTYKYVPTATGDVTFTLNTDVYKVVVTRGAYTAKYKANKSAGEIDGKIRNLSGTWEFTGEGSFETGTVIKDVPGIEVTMNKGTNDLHVTRVDTKNRYHGLVLMSTSNTDHTGTIVFKPYVNGFISLQGNFYNCVINDGTSNIWNSEGNPYYQNLTEINVPLIAGKTYTLSSTGSYSWEFHGFTFRPAFLVVDSSTGNLTNTEASKDSENPFAANMNLAKDRFPHLITSAAGEGKVKFAGDRDIVNLEGDNDVILIGSGSTIIKGTVLLEGSDEELFTYYYLQSTIMNLTATKFNGNKIEDQDYVDDSESNDTYKFTFSANIDKVSDAAFKVYLRTDAGDDVDITSKATISDTDLDITFADGDLVDGSTYRITIASGAIKATSDATLTNALIQRIFSINKSGELELELLHPTNVANVGTSIVIGADVKLNDKFKGTGRLKKDGSDKVIAVTFTISDKRLIAKPNETLENNTSYTLIVDAGSIKEHEGTNKVLTNNKAFSFTTGASAGTAPVPVAYAPANDPEGNIPLPASWHNKGRVAVTFDQTVELEAYSIVYATPVNGSEAQTSTTSLSGETATLNVADDGKTVYFEYNNSEDYLKYDLFYEIRIPANTVVSSGGKPNASDITFRFRMPKNPNATAVDPDEFYPHTWDFNRMGQLTDGNNSSSTADLLAKHAPNHYNHKNGLTVGNDNIDNNHRYYKYISQNSSSNGFDQGNDIYVATSASSESDPLPEFKGIRVSLNNDHSRRFEIRDEARTEYSEDGSTWRTLTQEENPSGYNADGTHKYVFRLNGNTHYMTLSNVPKGKLYMVANSKLLGINSPNAKFINLPDGVVSESDTKITNTGGIKKLVIDVQETGDVVFCVGDFSCEKIGVAVDYKKALSSYNNYFTDCQEPEMRYDLTNAFTETGLTAYYVDGSSFKKGDATIAFTPLKYNVAMAGEGTIIQADASNTSIPIFCADVNTTATDHTTSLVGVLEDTYIERIDGDKRNYFFTNIAGKVDPESGLPVEEFTSSPLGFYRAVASTLGAHKSYLQLPLNQTNARSIIYINFDGEGETTGIRNLDNNATVQQEGAYYTLTGIRLNGKPSVKGIYILNGKKVMIK